MSCEQVVARIEAMPFTALSGPHRERVEQHVGQCSQCRAVLAEQQAFESELGRLPEPPAPASLVPVIMARSAQEQNRPDPSDTRPVRSRSEGRVWTPLLTGLLAGISAFIYYLIQGDWTPYLTSSSLLKGTAAPLEMPDTNMATAVLAVGLLFFLAGLFAPFRTGLSLPARRG